MERSSGSALETASQAEEKSEPNKQNEISCTNSENSESEPFLSPPPVLVITPPSKTQKEKTSSSFHNSETHLRSESVVSHEQTKQDTKSSPKRNHKEAGSHAGGNGCKVQFYMAENGSSPPENRKHSRTGNRNRTNSESGTSITSSSSSYTLKAPDGGWGWVVVAAAFFVNMIADGVTFSFTYLFQELEKEFGQSKAVTSFAVSMFHAVPLLVGPIASALTDRYGCRMVTIVGSLLAAMGFFLSSFAPVEW